MNSMKNKLQNINVKIIINNNNNNNHHNNQNNNHYNHNIFKSKVIKF
jgi:hypothetical protein